MNKLQRFFPLLLFAGLLPAQQQQPANALQPDCVINFKLNASLGLNSTQLNNRQVGCYSWAVVYTSTTYSALSLTFQDAPDNAGVPGTWVTFAGTTVVGSNPQTAITQSIATFTGYYPWLRVNLSGTTGAGTVTGVFYGWRAQGARVTGGGGGSGDVTHTGTLTLNCAIIGNGGADIKCSLASIDTATGNFSTPGTGAFGVGGAASGQVDWTAITSGNTVSIGVDDNSDPGFAVLPGRTGFIALNTNLLFTIGNCPQYDATGNFVDSGSPCGGGGGTPGSPANSLQVNNGTFGGMSSALYNGTLGAADEGLQFWNQTGVTNVSSKAGPGQATNPFNTVLRTDDTVAYGIVLGNSAVTAFPNFRIDGIGDFIFNTPADLFLGFDRDAMQIFLGQTNLLMTGGAGTRFTWTSSDVTGSKDLGIARAAAGKMEVNNGTAGTLRDLTTRTIQVAPVAVASLPTCNSGAEGTFSAVTDALLPAFLTAVAGGGAVHAPVYCNGTAWIVF